MVHPKAADLPEAHVARQAEAAHAHALERRHLQPRARRQLAHLQHTRSRRPSAPQPAAVSCISCSRPSPSALSKTLGKTRGGLPDLRSPGIDSACTPKPQDTAKGAFQAACRRSTALAMTGPAR